MKHKFMSNLLFKIFLMQQYIKTKNGCMILDSYISSNHCTVRRKKTKHPYLFLCKLSYRNETRTNHHGLLSTSV